MKTIPKGFEPVYLCPVCGKGHLEKDYAIECSQRNEQPKHKVGDIVCMQLGYGWFDGDEKWVINKRGYEFHNKPTYRFWFVITAITPKRPPLAFHGDPDAHCIVYHVQTLALRIGDEGFSGWTHLVTHKRFYEVEEGIEPPPEVVEAAKEMLGREFSRLL